MHMPSVWMDAKGGASLNLRRCRRERIRRAVRSARCITRPASSEQATCIRIITGFGEIAEALSGVQGMAADSTGGGKDRNGRRLCRTIT